jgi:hypothetical protein
MAQGNSGRVVIEVDPDLKRHLYKVLNSRNLTLKTWFTTQARNLLAEHEQPSFLPRKPHDLEQQQ